MSTDQKPADPSPGAAAAWDSKRAAEGGHADLGPRPADPPPPQVSPLPEDPMGGPAPRGTGEQNDKAAS